MLSQVAGRAGRETTGGRALLQTHMPEHPVLQALVSGDRDAFLEREAEAREQAAMPPFGRLGQLSYRRPTSRKGLPFLRNWRAKPPATNMCACWALHLRQLRAFATVIALDFC